jgi:orotate phosphoribosyltransferase-like protein
MLSLIARLALRKSVLDLHDQGLSNKEISDRVKALSEDEVSKLIEEIVTRETKTPQPVEVRDGKEL